MPYQSPGINAGAIDSDISLYINSPILQSNNNKANTTITLAFRAKQTLQLPYPLGQG